jgi:hypothetical protein
VFNGLREYSCEGVAMRPIVAGMFCLALLSAGQGDALEPQPARKEMASYPCLWSSFWNGTAAPRVILPPEGEPVLKQLQHVAPDLPVSTLVGPNAADLIVELVVDVDGSVADIQVTRARPEAAEVLSGPVTDAIRRWTFEPLEVSGVSAVTCATVPLHLDRRSK